MNTTSHFCIMAVFAIISLFSSPAVIIAQTRGPSPIYDAQTTGQRAAYDRVSSPRPGFAIGWNWGASLLGVNTDLQTNLHHMENPWRWSGDSAHRPNFPLNNLPPRTSLVIAPSDEVPATDFPTLYEWYQRARNLDNTPPNSKGNEPLDVGKGSVNGLSEGLGLRFHPELDVSDTTQFEPVHGTRQRAGFGFRERLRGTTTTDTTGGADLRWHLSADSVSGWEQVLGQSWPQQEFVRWPKGDGIEQWAPFTGKRMVVGIHLRRTDTTDVAMDDDTVLRLRVMTQRMDTPTHTVAAIRFDSIPNATAMAIALPNRLDGTGRGLVRPMELKDTSLTVEEIVITRRMLPAGNAAVRDITVKAHFRAERVEPITIPANARISNRLLREHWARGKMYESAEIANANIIAMWVEVDYRGNSDVAIDWVQIGTENYTWLLEGWYDQQFRTTWQRIVDSLDTYNTRRFGTADHADRLRLWRWFSRDEGPEMYWEGMGYFRDLLGPSLTEVGVTKRSRFSQQVYHHLTGSDENWDGATIAPHLNVIAPYYARGYDSVDSIKRSHLGHTWGRHSIARPSTDTVDYDLFWNGHTGIPTPPSPMKLPITATTDPTGDVLRYPLGLRTGGGMQSHYELHKWLLKQTPWFMFWDKTPWLANLWLTPGIKYAAERPSWTQLEIEGHGPRFVTGEEATLLAWSHIIRGAKGLVYWWGPNRDSAVSHGHAAVEGTFPMGLAYAPPHEEITRFVWNVDSNRFDGTKVLRDTTQTRAQNITMVDNRTSVLQGLAARSPAIGPDWLADDNSTGLWQAMSENTNPTFAEQLANIHLGDTTRNQLYLGWLSVRSALQAVGETMSRCQDDVAELKLRGWHSRGFRTWSLSRSEADSIPVANASAFDGILAVTAFRTRHPHRDGPYDWPTWEPLDSSFVEASVLKIDTVPMSERYVVGILNRRVSPFDYERGANGSLGTASTDSNHFNVDQFHTYEEWRLAVVADTLPGKPSRHRRMGSRQIDIPFRSGDPTVVLRIRELGGQADEAMGYVPIDTIVGASTGLKVDFLPGEGKMFEVTRMSAYSVADSGHLVHSNQRKMVVFPQADSIANLPSDSADACFVVAQDTVDSLGRGFFRMINDTVARYHRVWHTTGIPLTVWYQRSEPVAIDLQSPTSAARTPLLTWEEPILLSGTVVVPPHGGNPIDTLITPSSGYPAIVVRFNHDVTAQMTRPGNEYYTASGGAPPQVSQAPYARQSVVYVVFTSEPISSVDTLPNGNMPFYVVEAMLPADMPRAAQVAALAAMPARVIQHVQGKAYNGLMGERPYMWSWGTPMINASADGNWYCWSTNLTQGIGFGFKRPGQLALASTAIVPRANGGTTWRATHPTLNSYSRLHLGERDAAMAWQEGTDAEAGSQIFYTRLRLSAAGAAQHFLTNATTPAPSIGAHVDVVGGNRVRMSSGYGHLAVDSTATLRLSYPTLFRNLSDYEIGVDNSRYDLRLVNHKGDRMWWQARYKYTDSTWGDVLTRKWIDVDNHSVRDASQPDVVVSSPQHYMWAKSGDKLFRPELSQGEQTTEMFSSGQDIVPNPTGPWWQDSVNSLSLEYVDGTQTSWALTVTYGWDLYADSVNNLITNLYRVRATVSDGVSDAIYPHAAARYTNAHMPGYSWNRRIHQTPYAYHGTYHAATTNPDLSQWSAGFFKETPQYQYQIRGFDGFATDEWSLAVANVSVDGSKPLAYGSAASAVDAQASMFARKELKRTSVYASEPFLVDGYRQLDMRVHVIGDMPKGMLAIERISDGQRFDVEIGDPAAVVQRADEPLVPQVVDLSVALVEGKGSEYRLVLNADAPTTMPTQHLELYMPATEDLRKGSEVRRVVNLATGGTSTLEGGTVLRIQPQPATDVVTIIVDAGEAARRSGTALTMNVVGAHGSAWYSQQVAASDFVRLDVSSWPAGVYAVTLASHKGVTSTARFVVVR